MPRMTKFLSLVGAEASLSAQLEDEAMGKRSDDPFDEVIDMVEQTMRSVADVKQEVAGLATDHELREAEKDMRDYTDKAVAAKAGDQITTLQQMMENMGTSLLNDFEEMGKDTETRLFGRLEKFIEEELTPLVGRLVTDEVRRKAELEEQAEARRKAEQETIDLRRRTERAERRLRIVQWVGAFGVVVSIGWTVFRFITQISGAG